MKHVKSIVWGVVLLVVGLLLALNALSIIDFNLLYDSPSLKYLLNPLITIFLSSSSKNPSFLFILGNTPSFNPIINIAFTLWLLDLSTSPKMTWSCVPGIFVKLLFLKPTFKICAYLSIDILSSLNTNTITSNISIIVFKLLKEYQKQYINF